MPRSLTAVFFVLLLLLSPLAAGQVIFQDDFESPQPGEIAPSGTAFVLALSTRPDAAQLAWLEASDNTTAPANLTYRLHYSTQSGFEPDEANLYAEFVGETSTDVLGLSAATTYFFRLAVRDADGNDSDFTDEIDIATATGDTLISSTADWARAGDDLALGEVLERTDTSLTFALLPESILPTVGQILVGEDTRGDGYLRRVLSISGPANGEITVTTEDATLADIVEATTINGNLNLFDVVEEEGSRLQRDARGRLYASNQRVWDNRLLTAVQVDHIPRTGGLMPRSTRTVSTSDGELSVYHPANVITKAGERVRFDVEATIDSDHSDDFDITGLHFLGLTHPNLSSGNSFGATFTDTSPTTAPGDPIRTRSGRFSWTTTADDSESNAYTAAFTATAEKRNCLAFCSRTVDLEIDISVDRQGRYVVTSSSAQEMGLSLQLDFAPDMITAVELSGARIDSAEVRMQGSAVFDALAYYRFQGAESVNIEKPVFTRRYRSVYFVGPVPIYQEITLTADVQFTADAAVAIEADANARLEYDFDLGARYVRGSGWEAIDERNTDTELTLDLGVQGGVNAEIRLIPNLEVRFYKAASAGVSLEPYLEGHLEAEYIAEADLLELDSYGQYRLTRLDAGFGLESKTYASLDVFDVNILRYPASGEQTLFDLKFPLFSLPELSAQNLTGPITTCQPAALQAGATDGVNNPFDPGSIRWATYPSDADLAVGGSDPFQAEFVSQSAGDYKIFFIGKGEALGNIARQFETLEISVQAGAGGCRTLTVSKAGTGTGTVTSQPSGIHCGGSCSYSFAQDQTVTLSAVVGGDSVFQGWSGAGCSGTGTCTVTLDSAQSVTASFALDATAIIETDVTGVTVPEGGTADVQVRLTRQPDTTATVTTSRGSGDTDLTVQSGASLSFTPSNWSSYRTVTLAAAEDSDQSNGTATFTLSIPGLADRTLIATEADNDGTPTGTHPLNDTGIDWCADGNTNHLTCPVTGYPGQDGEFGRDARARAGTLTKTGTGAAGFDYTKLDANGNALPADAPDWSCVHDNHTGRIWEVKTDDGGLRDKNHEYTWYNPDPNTNGGGAGVQDGGSCTGSACDTDAYVQAVNAQGLCGANDWRMPTRSELMSIVNNGQVNPTIDTDYFLNTPAAYFWASSSIARYPDSAWHFRFYNGDIYPHPKSNDGRVRLVRGRQPLHTDSEVTCTNENTAIPATTPTSAFTVLGDGSIVRHEVTGLEWQRCALGQSWDGATCQGTAASYTWPQALQAAAAQPGWRLPDRNELASIFEQRCWTPAINTAIFPNTPTLIGESFWSSSSDAGNRFSAWSVNFGGGSVSGGSKMLHDFRVRLVRAGQ